MSFTEKRSHVRYVCDGGVEVRPESSAGGFWGTLTDISLGGCYVQTFSPLPAGTQVNMRVQTKSVEFTCAGNVQASHPGDAPRGGHAGRRDRTDGRSILAGA